MWLKMYVGVLMFADTLNTLFSCWWIFDLTIMQFGNLAKFAVSNWSKRLLIWLKSPSDHS